MPAENQRKKKKTPKPDKNEYLHYRYCLGIPDSWDEYQFLNDVDDYWENLHPNDRERFIIPVDILFHDDHESELMKVKIFDTKLCESFKL